MRKISILSTLILLTSISLASATTVYHGNVNSKIYHNKNCEYFNSKHATAVFYSQKAAEEAGFKKCKLCFDSKTGHSIAPSGQKVEDVFSNKTKKSSEQKIDTIFQ